MERTSQIAEARPGRTLLFGLGNPIMSDDAIGLIVARQVYEAVGPDWADVLEAAVAGLDIVDLISGYEKVIIVDAITTEGGTVGQLHWLRPDDIVSTPRLTASHDMSLAEALAFGRQLGLPMPRDVVICAVEAGNTRTFGESLSPGLAQLLPKIVDAIVETQFSQHRSAAEWRS